MMFGKNKGAIEIAKRIPLGSVGVEIGVWRGDSSALFLERAKHIHLVDPWALTPYKESDEFGDYKAYLQRYTALVGSGNPEQFQRYYDNVYASVALRFGDKATIHRMTSAEFFISFHEPVDWAYIDGSHSYAGCLADLRGARKITKVIYGDDYGNKVGVTRAVDDFAKESGLNLSIIGNQYEFT